MESESEKTVKTCAIQAERTRAEKAEADARQARNETVLERESYEQMHDVAIKWAALAADATARAEEAEAEWGAMRARLAPSVEYVDGLACGYGEDEIDRLTGVLTRLVNRVTEMETDQDWPTSWPQTDDARRILGRKK